VHAAGRRTDGNGVTVAGQRAECLFQRLIFGPVVIQPDCKTSRSAASSASPIDGRENGKKSLIMFLFCNDPRKTGSIKNILRLRT
jgi:hypothetical protein